MALDSRLLTLDQPSGGSVRLWSGNLDAFDDRLVEFEACLSAKEQARATETRNPQVRRRFVVRRGLLREILAEALGTLPAQIELEEGPHGKPFLQRGEIEFNIASSRDQALFAISHGVPVGVDIEFRDPEFDMAPVIRQSFSVQEADALRKATGTQERTMFFDAWTIKEAVAKASGLGFHAPFCQVTALGKPVPRPIVLRVNGMAEGYEAHSIEGPQGFSAALAIRVE